MDKKKIKQLQNAVMLILNFDGWELKHSGKNLKGKTPKGFDCIIEMNFIKIYNERKPLEKNKYNYLMSLDKNIIKIYFVNDPKGNFMYWLNNLKMPSTIEKGLQTEVYLLKENDASRININNLLK